MHKLGMETQSSEGGVEDGLAGKREWGRLQLGKDVANPPVWVLLPAALRPPPTPASALEIGAAGSEAPLGGQCLPFDKPSLLFKKRSACMR